MLKKIFTTFMVFVFLPWSFIFADDISVSSDLIEANSSLVTDCLSTVENTSSPPSINSRSAVVIERNTGTILFGKNEHAQVKMASTTKIMTALIVIENCNLTDDVVVSKKAASTGGSRLGLRENDKVSVQDLLYGLMLLSGNDTAVALAEHVGGSIDRFCRLNEF